MSKRARLPASSSYQGVKGVSVAVEEKSKWKGRRRARFEPENKKNNKMKKVNFICGDVKDRK